MRNRDDDHHILANNICKSVLELREQHSAYRHLHIEARPWRRYLRHALDQIDRLFHYLLKRATKPGHLGLVAVLGIHELGQCLWMICMLPQHTLRDSFTFFHA